MSVPASLQAKADDGDSSAQYEVGFHYINRNSTLSAQWLEKAVAQGHAGAMFWLGRMYYLGKGVMLNIEKAISLYKESARNGYEQAQLHVGMMLLSGNEIAKDEQKALSYLVKAANKGNYLARCRLKEMRETGTNHYDGTQMAVGIY